jgi:hypothetical protein
MGQFKPMVKMMTTEPSVELKLKKGGEVKKAMGGAMPAVLPSAMPARGGMMPAARPAKPSLAARRKAMAVPPPMMKKGGEMESKATHKAEMAKMGKIEKELKSHEGKPASKAHKGLKTGGVANAQGGYKDGGIINTENQGGAYRDTKMHTAKPDNSPAKTGKVKEGNGGGYATGGVAKSNAGGYKKGGATKKFARGGAVQDDGAAVEMPQGNKRPARPVSINQLSGTYKKGGSVKKYDTGGAVDPVIARETKRMEAEKAAEKAENEATREAILGFPKRIYEGVKGLFTSPEKKPGSVTKTEKSVTVSPAKKRGGSVEC